MEEVRDQIQRRFVQVATPQHLLAYIIDHRRMAMAANNEHQTEMIEKLWIQPPKK